MCQIKHFALCLFIHNILGGIEIGSLWYLWIIILIFCIIIPRIGRDNFYFQIIKRKRKGIKRKMPYELVKEFIGKVCWIRLFNDTASEYVKIIAVEDNWVKVEQKGKGIRLINGDMIKDITIAPEKYQKMI